MFETKELSTERRELNDLADQAIRLGCALPSGICLFPRNFDTAQSSKELEFDDLGQTIRKLWSQAGIKEEPLALTNPRYLQERNHIPQLCIFIGWSVLSQDPILVQLAFGVVGNYLTDIFKGHLPANQHACKVRIILQSKKGKEERYTEVKFEGNPKDLEKIMEVFKHES